MKSLCKLLVCLSLAFSVFGNLPKCTKYSNAELNEGECSKFALKDGVAELYVKECPEKKYCHYEFPDTPESCSDHPAQKYPGEHCTENAECLSQVCEKVCVSRVTSGCKSHGDCATGHYCNSAGQCTSLKNDTESCSSSEPCHVNLICNKNVCVKPGSLAEGAVATAPAACQSFYIKEGKCHKGLHLVNGTHACTDQYSLCEYEVDGGKFLRSCKCGMTDKGTSFCRPGEADINPKPVFSQ